jgi:hypothetical protein
MSQAFSAAAAAGHQMLRHKRFQQLQLQATRCYVPKLPNTARKAISQFQLQAAKHCAQSYFSSSSCRLPNSVRKAISAMAGCQTLRAKLFQQFQLQAAKHCAQSYFSSLKLPNTREK